jgi:hypothetical protein
MEEEAAEGSSALLSCSSIVFGIRSTQNPSPHTHSFALNSTLKPNPRRSKNLNGTKVQKLAECLQELVC